MVQTAPSIPWSRRLLLASLCAAAVANVYYAQPLLGQMGIDLGLDASQVGWIVAAGQAGYLVGLVLLVPLGDRLPRRTLIALQLGAAAVTLLLAATAGGAASLLIALALTGLFSVVVQVVVAYTAALSSDADRGRNMGVVTGGVVIGIVLARTVSGAVADLAGWRTVYTGSAGLLLLLAIVALLRLPTQQPASTPFSYRSAVLSVFTWTRTSRVFRTRALITLFLFASFGTLWSGMVLPLADAPWQLSTAQIGLFGIGGLVGALGATRAGRWADRGHGERVTGIALVLLLGSWHLIGQVNDSLVLFFIGVVILDFAVQAVHVSSQHRIVTDAPASGSRIIGSYMVYYSVGSGLGAVATTALYSGGGWVAVTVLGAAFAGAALLIWLVDRVVPIWTESRSEGGVDALMQQG